MMTSVVQNSQGAGPAAEAVRVRRYLIDGREGSKKEFAAQPFVVAGAGLPDEGAAYGFATEEALCRWAAGTRHADRFARAIGTMKVGQQLEGTDGGALAARRLEAAVRRVKGELQELGRETGLDVGSPEFLAQADPRGSVVAVAAIPTLLFDRVEDPGLPPRFGGAFFPVLTATPTLFGFNDRASGAIVVGFCTLHDKTFFRGPAAFLVGLPFARFVLDDLGFDNRAASAIQL